MTNKKEPVDKAIKKLKAIVDAPMQDNKKINAKLDKKVPKKKIDNELSHNQIMFCEEYIKTQNGKQSYLKVYTKCKPESAESSSVRLIGNEKVKKYIDERLKPLREQEKKEEKSAIADANEILETFTKIFRGDDSIKDQMGFDVSVKDRITAGKELAKRYGLFIEPEKTENNAVSKKIEVEVVDHSDLESVMYENKKG